MRNYELTIWCFFTVLPVSQGNRQALRAVGWAAPVLILWLLFHMGLMLEEVRKGAANFSILFEQNWVVLTFGVSTLTWSLVPALVLSHNMKIFSLFPLQSFCFFFSCCSPSLTVFCMLTIAHLSTKRSWGWLKCNDNAKVFLHKPTTPKLVNSCWSITVRNKVVVPLRMRPTWLK